MNPKELVEQFTQLQEKFYTRDVKISPVHTNRASEIGHPCLRYLVYLRTRWQDQLPPPPKLLQVYRAGREQEELAKTQLREMGYIVKESIYNFHDPQLQLSGSIDCFISHPSWDNGRQFYAVEIKSVDRFTFEKVKNANDFLADKPYFFRKWYYQIQSYLYLVSQQKQEFEDFAFFVLRNKNNTELKLIDVTIDYDAIEDIMRRCALILKHITEKTLPERITDLSICATCPFRHICLPPLDSGQGLDAEIDEEILNAVKRLHELETQLEEFEELQAEYDQLKEFLKERLKPKFEAGSLEILAGNYIIKAQRIEQTRLDSKRIPEEIKQNYLTKTIYYKLKVIPL